MALYKNVASQKVAVFAYGIRSDAEEPGDAANITAQISLDGGACAATNDVNPTEVDAVDAPGIYLFDLLQAETDCDLFILFAKSSTKSIKLEPAIIYTLPGDNAAIDVNAVEVEGLDATDQINAACDTALSDYDAPTKAEMDTGLAALNDPTANDVADAVLKRDWTSVSGEAARSVLNALRFLRNKWAISGSTLTVKEEDDSTTAWTSDLTVDVDADPVTASDPT